MVAMRPEKPGVVLLLAFVVSVLVANGAFAQATRGFAVGADPVLLMPSRAPSSWAVMTTAAQDPPAAKAALGLDRPTRRVIQQGLQNEGFDPGVPDGLFGPRTRAAIRRWQEARGVPPTGYLDSAEAELLRVAGAPRPPVSEAAVLAEPQSTSDAAPSSPAADASVDRSSAALNCEDWNTEAFFEMATASTVTACLAAGADVAARDDQRITPLHWAAWSSTDPAVVEALLTVGADVEARNGNDMTPLHNAALNNGNPTVVEAFLMAGASIEARNGNDMTPLHNAALNNGNPTVVEALLMAGANIEATRDSDSATSLQLAAAFNENPSIVEALLAGGADRTLRISSDWTLLHLAARFNENPAVIRTLLGAGADIDARDDNNNTPLHLAAQHNENQAVIEALLAAGADVNALDASLFRAVGNNKNSAVVEVLLAAGANVNAGGNYTPLHRALDTRTPLWRELDENPAVAHVLLAVVDALLAAGADLAVRTDLGSTPLHLALLTGVNSGPVRQVKHDIVDALLAAGADLDGDALQSAIGISVRTMPGLEDPALIRLIAAAADVNSRDDSGSTPLIGAAGHRSVPVLQALLSAGADVAAARAIDERTALHLAAENNDAAAVRYLLSAGADVMARDDDGATPLHVAEDPEVVRVLFAAGADLSARDTTGRTPLHAYASIRLHPGRVDALLAAGADANARARNGDTPLHLSDAPTTIDSLIAAGADLEARNARGHTPLHSLLGRRYRFPSAAAANALVTAGANLEARDERGNTPLHLAAAWLNAMLECCADSWLQSHPHEEPHAGGVMEVLLEAGANPMARNADGRTPWDLAQQNQPLKESDAYWRLNDARFNATRQESRRGASRPPLPPIGGLEQPGRQGPGCEIPGYPNPIHVESLGLNWCGASVGLQRRAIALQAAGAWCAIAEGTSSSPEQVSARHQDINAACDALDALGALGGPPCECPTGYRP